MNKEERSPDGQKTGPQKPLWEKEKLFVTSPFPRVYACLGKSYRTIPTFNKPEKIFWKTLWEKEKMLETSIFSFSTVFSTLSKTEIIILVTLIVCKCFEFGSFQTFVVWLIVNPFLHIFSF